MSPVRRQRRADPVDCAGRLGWNCAKLTFDRPSLQVRIWRETAGPKHARQSGIGRSDRQRGGSRGRHQIAIAQLVAKVPAHTQNGDISGTVPSPDHAFADRALTLATCEPVAKGVIGGLLLY